MIPVPIPEGALWPGARRIVMSAPDGDLTNPDIAPAEAILDATALGRRYTFRLVLGPGELEALQAGAPVLLSFIGGVPPFSAEVSDDDIPGGGQ